jgi:hypothetical protein
MPEWISTILIAAGTSLFVGWFISPRLEARNRRIQEVHQAREKFFQSVCTLEIGCARLRGFHFSPGASEAAQATLRGERDRWLARIEETSAWLIDDADSYINCFRRGWEWEAALMYVTAARMLWISSWPVAAKLVRLQELSKEAATAFQPRPWRIRAILRAERKLDQLMEKLLTDLETNIDSPPG